MLQQMIEGVLFALLPFSLFSGGEKFRGIL
jgi:hypothetical protein